jgi:hypothetical protein
MPIKFHRTKKQPLIRPSRGRGFDAAILKLAPIIAERQSVECPELHELARQLNGLGLVAPSGNRFSYTTTRRIVVRLAQLGLCVRPMTLTESKERRARKIARLAAAELARIAEKYKK